jgi:hypothetical protein
VRLATVNLDTDSDNDGVISHAVDDPIEMSAPGRLVAVREHGHDPLAAVQIDPIGLSTWVSGNIMATLSASNNIRVYADTAGTQLLFPAGSTGRTWDAATEALPTNVYVAGLTPGSASLTWTVVVDGYAINDSVAFTVVTLDLDVDSNNDGEIDPNNGLAGKDDRIEEEPTGQIIFANTDDDDGNGVADEFNAGPVAGENDLARVLLTVGGHSTSFGSIILTYDESIVRLYEHSDRRGPIASGVAIATGGVFYAEGRAAGTTIVTATFTASAAHVADTTIDPAAPAPVAAPAPTYVVAPTAEAYTPFVYDDPPPPPAGCPAHPHLPPPPL